MKRLASTLILVMLVVCMFALASNAGIATSSPMTITVPDDYPTIQAAIDAANLGGTVYVKSGTYHGSIVLNKTLSLLGQNAQNTWIIGSGFDAVVRVTASDVNISGFMIRGGGFYWGGIRIDNASHCSVTGNNMIKDGSGVLLLNSSNSAVLGNNITASVNVGVCLGNCNNSIVSRNNITAGESDAISLFSGDNNDTVSENNVTNNLIGIAALNSSDNTVFGNNIANSTIGVMLGSFNDNRISENNITDNQYGIQLGSSSNNTFTGNNVANNNYGIEVDSSNNKIYHNNFVNNTQQVNTDSVNAWDDGYPSGGNYWSDYAGKDVYGGSYQNETGLDWIGDTPYLIDLQNQDRYPLTGLWTVATRVIVPDGYPTIQSAVDAVNSGGIVYVRAGTYYENVVVAKSLSLVGESSQNTIIDGNGAGDVITVTVGFGKHANVSGLTVRNSGDDHAGFHLFCSGCNVTGNNITDNFYGVFFRDTAGDNMVSGNDIANNVVGVELQCEIGNMYIFCGPNMVFGNNITANREGIILDGGYCNYNTVSGNNVTNNGVGVSVYGASGNRFFHNNFVDNTLQVNITGRAMNSWDDGYPSGGNHWSDYRGSDLHSGSYQNLADGDGIGDKPYIIDAHNQDNYPLMNAQESSFWSYAIGGFVIAITVTIGVFIATRKRNSKASESSSQTPIRALGTMTNSKTIF